MTNSVKPQILTLTETLRIDQGADWFHTFFWQDSRGNPIDLGKWSFSATAFLSSSSPTTPVAIADGQFEIIETNPSLGELKLIVDKSVTESLVFTGKSNMTLCLEVVATNTVPDLGYTPGQCLSFIKGQIGAYPHGSGR